MKCPPSKAAGFTLIELMISIALVVVLMLGITKVFSLTSQTAGATNQMSSAMRDARGAQATLYQDFSTAVSDGSPCMLICSSRVSAFRNKADQNADRDFNPADPVSAQQNEILTVDLNGDNQEGDHRSFQAKSFPPPLTTPAVTASIRCRSSHANDCRGKPVDRR